MSSPPFQREATVSFLAPVVPEEAQHLEHEDHDWLAQLRGAGLGSEQQTDPAVTLSLAVHWGELYFGQPASETLSPESKGSKGYPVWAHRPRRWTQGFATCVHLQPEFKSALRFYRFGAGVSEEDFARLQRQLEQLEQEASEPRGCELTHRHHGKPSLADWVAAELAELQFQASTHAPSRRSADSHATAQVSYSALYALPEARTGFSGLAYADLESGGLPEEQEVDSLAQLPYEAQVATLVYLRADFASPSLQAPPVRVVKVEHLLHADVLCHPFRYDLRLVSVRETPWEHDLPDASLLLALQTRNTRCFHVHPQLTFSLETLCLHEVPELHGAQDQASVADACDAAFQVEAGRRLLVRCSPASTLMSSADVQPQAVWHVRRGALQASTWLSAQASDPAHSYS